MLHEQVFVMLKVLMLEALGCLCAFYVAVIFLCSQMGVVYLKVMAILLHARFLIINLMQLNNPTRIILFIISTKITRGLLDSHFSF